MRIALAIGDDELARFLELDEFVADFLQGGRGSGYAAQFHVDAFDVGIGLGLLDVAQNVVQTGHVLRLHRLEIDASKRVVGRAVGNGIVELHVKHRIGLQGGGGFRLSLREARYHGRNHADLDEKVDHQGNQCADECGKDNFVEFHDDVGFEI